MAAEPQEADEKEKGEANGSRFRFDWRRMLSKRSLAILVIASIIVHGMGISYVMTVVRASQAALFGPEYTIGEFRYESSPDEPVLVHAEFMLHVRLLSGMERSARRTIDSHKYKVQQEVEELIRQAHGGDFEDPLLAGLKRQLFEKINATLQTKAVDEVIITDFSIERAAPPEHDATADLDAAAETAATSAADPAERGQQWVQRLRY